MIPYFKKLLAPEELGPSDKDIFRNELYFSGLTSLAVFSGMLVIAGVVLLFLWNYPAHGPEYFQSHPGELYRNYLYTVFLVVQPFYLLNYFLKVCKSPKAVTKPNRFIVVAEALFFLCWAAAISSADQLIHGDISAYLMACFTIAAVVRLLPWQFMFCYGLSLVVFLLGISRFQADPARLAAHYVNGPIMVLLALITSILMYQAVLRAFAYRTTIQKQKDEMEIRVQERTADLARANEELKAEIRERAAAENKMMYLSMHDPLTGLYNRSFFEERMRQMERERRIDVGLIVCDVDGLKLVNDTMGHDRGDSLLVTTANLIKICFRSSDIIARVGGDEFAIILPYATPKILEEAYQRLRENSLSFNPSLDGIPLSLSIGYALKTDPETSLNALFIEADNNMYREKLYRSQSTRSAIVQTLMKALEARDFITEGHAERLQVMVADMGAALGLPPQSITDLRLLAQFHDIGKVGIPDRILFKAGRLTPEEKTEMERHSEIGYRIALSSPDLMHIAGWVLKHHEWWNGEGYPLGLQGKDIPLECRILAIADAYDAMTSDRPYRKALSHEEAVAELRRCAGIQFDPHLVEQFNAVLSRFDHRENIII